MLFQQASFWVRHLALGTTEQRAPVQGGRQSDLTGLRTRFLFLRCLGRLFLLLLLSSGSRRRAVGG